MKRARFYIMSSAISLFLIISIHFLADFLRLRPTDVLAFAVSAALLKDICDYVWIYRKGRSIGQPEFEHLPFSMMALAYAALFGAPLLFRLALIDSIFDGTQDLGAGKRQVMIAGAVVGLVVAVLSCVL
ncbi:MAG: hypothetical protein QW567_03790 [Candidatus Hadarchaeales archaeon]